jgi:hypothetical protein
VDSTNLDRLVGQELNHCLGTLWARYVIYGTAVKYSIVVADNLDCS